MTPPVGERISVLEIPVRINDAPTVRHAIVSAVCRAPNVFVVEFVPQRWRDGAIDPEYRVLNESDEGTTWCIDYFGDAVDAMLAVAALSR